MADRQLRIYSDVERPAPSGPPANTRMTLRDLMPLLASAQRMNLTWLRDFLDDEIMVTADLHDVLMAYRASRKTG
jgi:hypothetical protein